MTELVSLNGEASAATVSVTDKFRVRKFRGADSPDDELRVWRMHASSYVASGYVSEAGAPEGVLHPDIDTARGDNITYYLGENEFTGAEASLRKKSISETGDLHDLTKFSNSNYELYPEVDARLRQHIGRHGVQSVVEICALSDGGLQVEGMPASLALVRSLVHESAEKMPDERWLILFVKVAYMSFRKRFGDTIVEKGGEEISPPQDSLFINPRLRFVPAVINPSGIMETLESESRSDRISRRDAKIRRQTRDFMRDGADIEIE